MLKIVIIKRPILRGRDIKKYTYDFADIYLITTFPSLKINIDNYPAVKEHLLSFGYDRLKQTGDKGARKKSNNKWYETQDTIGYWEDFSKQNIIYNDITQKLTFCISEKDMFFNNTVYFIQTSKSIKYFLAILNSELINWLYKTISVQLGEKAVRMFTTYVEKIPIPTINNEKEEELNKIIDELYLNIQKHISTKELESKIDKIVYELYELNENEIDFINDNKII